MSEENQSSSSKPADDDKELSDLLDSALQDFSKSDSSENKVDSEKKEKNAVVVEEGKISVSEDTEWTEEFIKQTTADFETNIAKLLNFNDGQITPENIQQSFQKMAEAAAQVVSNPTVDASSSNFANTISQTLQDLTQRSENINNPFSEQDLLNMLGSQNDRENPFVPFMQGMMQGLLSKEVLYPSLKDLLDRYPGWLEANGGSLEREQLEKYEKQQELMKEICAELETEKDSDTDEQKKKRFETVLSLMQKLENYGQPPKELIGENDLGLPPINDQVGAEQCAQM